MDQLSEFNLLKKENQQLEQMYTEREEVMNILSYVDFAKLCRVINFFPELNQTLEKMLLLSLSHQVQEPLNGEKNLHEIE